MSTLAIGPAQDTTLDEAGILPSGGAATFRVGWSSLTGTKNALLDFNIESVLGPPTEALLRLRCTIGAADARDLVIAMVDPAAPWNGVEADWDEYDNGQFWAVPGGDFDPDGAEASGFTLPIAGPDTLFYNVLPCLQNAISRDLPVLSLILTTGAGGADGIATYESMEGTITPVLAAAWIDPQGGGVWTGRFQEFTGRLDG